MPVTVFGAVCGMQAVKAALDVGNYEVDLYGLYKDTPELQRLFANLTVKQAAFGFHFNLSVPIIRDVTVFFPGIIGNTSSKDAVPPGWVDTVYTGRFTRSCMLSNVG